MRAVATIPIDYDEALTVQTVVDPLRDFVEGASLGSVLSYEIDEIEIQVQLKLRNRAAYHSVIQYLAESDAPVMTIIHRIGWFGGKKDIFMHTGSLGEH